MALPALAIPAAARVVAAVLKHGRAKAIERFGTDAVRAAVAHDGYRLLKKIQTDRVLLLVNRHLLGLEKLRNQMTIPICEKGVCTERKLQ
jgi:hypothetical protein